MRLSRVLRYFFGPFTAGHRSPSEPAPGPEVHEVEIASVEPVTTPVQELSEETADLPIYRWFANG